MVESFEWHDAYNYEIDENSCMVISAARDYSYSSGKPLMSFGGRSVTGYALCK